MSCGHGLLCAGRPSNRGSYLEIWRPGLPPWRSSTPPRGVFLSPVLCVVHGVDGHILALLLHVSGTNSAMSTYSRFFIFATILSGRKQAKNALAPGAGNLNVSGGPTTDVLKTVGGRLGVTAPVVRKEGKVAITMLGGSDPICLQ